MKEKNALGKYLFSLLLFGSNGVIASGIALSSHAIVLLRTLLGCALLTVLFSLTGNRIRLRENRRDLFFVALSGAAMAADWLFLFEAYARIGVSLGMLINYTGPAIVIALSPAVLREKISAPKIAALLLALLGAALIGGKAAIEGISAWGLFCAVMSALSYAVMVLANKKARTITGMQNATLQLFFTAIVVALFALIHGVRLSLSSSDCLPVLWLGLINTGLGCFFYFSSIGKLPAQSVAVCGYIEPMSAVILAAIVLREKLSGLQWLGALLIIGGAIYGELKHEKKDSVNYDRKKEDCPENA